MTLQTTTEYWTCLEKSGYFPADQMSDLKSRFSDVDDAPRLAKRLIESGHLTDWQARLVLSGRHHLKVGSYALLERLRGNALGDRFLAVHRNLDRKVVVNLFPPDVADQSEFFNALLAEASRVASLDHPNLVHLYDIDQEAGRYYLIFEYDPGTSLDRFPPGELDERMVASATRQMLEGLDCAHQAGLVHGQLSESEVRLDDQARIRVSNIGLASFMEQLRRGKLAEDAFANVPVAGDDLIATGKIARNLFTEHLGSAGSDSQRELESIIDELSHFVEGTGQSARSFADLLSAWESHWGTTLETATAETNVSSAAPLDPLAIPDEAMELATDASVASASASKAFHGDRAITGTTGTVPASKTASDGTSRTSYLPVVAGGAAALAVGLAGLWFFFFRDTSDSDSQFADAMTIDQAVGNSDLQGTDQNSNASPLDAAVGPSASNRDANVGPDEGPEEDGAQPLEQASNPPESSSTKDDVSETPDGPETSNGSSDDTPIKTSDSDRSGRDDTSTSPGQPENASSSNDAITTPTQQDTVPTTPKQEGASWQGKPVIAADAAAENVDQDVAVRGTIVSVGRTTGIHFLNFGRRGSGAFTGIVRDSALDSFDGDLKALFEGKEVLIAGKITLYNDSPQIVISDASQIAVYAADLVDKAAAMADAPPAGGAPTTSAAGGASTPAPAGQQFASLPAGLPIPPMENRDPVLLGQVQTGDALLGLELLSPPGMSRRGPTFSLIRDEETKKRWTVFYADRAGDEPTALGEIRRTDNNGLEWQWVAPADVSNSAGWIHNCLLRIASPDDSRIVAMRSPVELEPIVFTEKDASYRETLSIDWLPESEFITLELEKLPPAEFADQNSENGYMVAEAQPATEVYFNKDALQRVLAIGFTADISNRIKVEAELRFNTPGGFQRWKKSTFDDFGETVFAFQQAKQAEKTAADRYEPKYGEKTKHKDYVKELSKELELINAQVESFRQAQARVQQLFDRPIHYRVLYVTDEQTVELARTRGWTPIDAMASESDNE